MLGLGLGLASGSSLVGVSPSCGGRVRNINLNIYFQEINSFGWYNDTVKNSSITTKHLYLILTFRSHHEKAGTVLKQLLLQLRATEAGFVVIIFIMIV